MCSIILIRNSNNLIIATNRDELLDRPSEGPQIRKAGPFKNFSPQDQSKGGTWLGLNEKGLFVGITNRFTPTPNKSLKSRGVITKKALEASSPSEALSQLSQFNPKDFNPFHLLISNRVETQILWSDGLKFNQLQVTDSSYILTESSFGAGENKRLTFLKSHLKDLSADDSSELFKRLLSLKSEPSFEGPLVYMPSKNYGTRSSFVIKLTPLIESSEFYYSDVPPDQNRWIDFKEILIRENFQFS